MRTNKNGVNKDQKDKVKKDGYNRGQHCVYCLTYHMIFVTHYRKPVINDEMSAAMKEFSNHMAEQFRGKVLSAETDRDHIHLLVSLPPNTNISVFVTPWGQGQWLFYCHRWLIYFSGVSGKNMAHPLGCALHNARKQCFFNAPVSSLLPVLWFFRSI